MPQPAARPVCCWDCPSGVGLEESICICYSRISRKPLFFRLSRQLKKWENKDGNCAQFDLLDINIMWG